MDLRDFRHLFSYDDWANGEALHSLQGTPSAPRRPLDVMAHVAATQWVWMDRLRTQAQRCPVWPGWTLEQTAAELADLRPAWQQYFNHIGGAGLAGKIFYTNSKGEKFSNSVEEILSHVCFHGVYHRGQIAAAVRAASGAPAYTDYIGAVRDGKVSGDA